MLSRKMWRTVGRYRAQFASMVVMIALGTGVFIGFNMEWYSIESNVQHAFGETGFADYRLVDAGGFSQEDLDSVLAIDGVSEGTRYVSVNAKAKNGSDTITMTVTTNPKVSGFLVMSGDPYDPTDADGVWLSDRYAHANGVGLGDPFAVTYKGTDIAGTVRGLIKSGEYLIYLQDDAQMMPDFSTSGFAYVSPAMMESAMGYQHYSQINVLSGLDRKEFAERANDALGRVTLCIPKEDTVSYSKAMGESEEGKTMAAVLPVLFLAIAVLTMMTTMHRITTNEKVQIGTLKALGFRNGRIRGHYSSCALAIGIAGTLFGGAVGYCLAYSIMNPNGPMGAYMDLPGWGLSLPAYTYAVLVLINALLVAVGYLSVSTMLKGTAADSLKPYVPRNVRSLFIERFGLWNRLGFGTRWNIRDTFRHKSRSLMTVIGVLGCVMLLVASFGIKDTADSFIGVFYGDAINYETVINLSDEATNEDAVHISEMYSGDWASRTQVLLGDGAVGLEVYNIANDHVRFFDIRMNRVELSDGGAYICRRISEDTGLGVGDTITFKAYFTGQTHSVKVAGVLSSMSRSIIMTSGTADSAGIAYDINTVYTDEADVPLSNLIESTESKEYIVRALDAFMEVMNRMILLLVAAAVVLGAIVLYNLGTLSYMERTRDMATLKIVGYRDRQIGRILIGQNVWVTIAGIAAGIPLGIFVLDYLLHALASEYEMVLSIGWGTYAVSILATFAVSTAVGWMISRNNRRIDMVEALKGAE